MIIHISQTSQSYLVPEKKTIIFLKHAGVTKADIDMNIQLPLSGCHEARNASTLAGTRGHKAAPRRNDSSLESNTSSSRVIMCRLLMLLQNNDEKWMALTT